MNNLLQINMVWGINKLMCINKSRKMQENTWLKLCDLAHEDSMSEILVINLQDYLLWQSKRPQSEHSLLWKPQTMPSVIFYVWLKQKQFLSLVPSLHKPPLSNSNLTKLWKFQKYESKEQGFYVFWLPKCHWLFFFFFILNNQQHLD
jgi:hypothetical protein